MKDNGIVAVKFNLNVNLCVNVNVEMIEMRQMLVITVIPSGSKRFGG